jgi:hypothetical protein
MVQLYLVIYLFPKDLVCQADNCRINRQEHLRDGCMTPLNLLG